GSSTTAALVTDWITAAPVTTETSGAGSLYSSGIASGEVKSGITGFSSVSCSSSGLTEPSSPALSTEGRYTCEFRNVLTTSTTSSVVVSPSAAVTIFSFSPVCVLNASWDIMYLIVASSGAGRT